VHLLRKTQQKQKLKPLSKQDLDDGEDLVIDDEVSFGRNRKSLEFGKVIHEDVEISDYVKFRLWLARQSALRKYEEVWT
jgi:hypothetical protein